MTDHIPELAFRLYLGVNSGLAAILFVVCGLLITHKRTYYPLLRRMFQVLSAVFGGNAAAQYFDPVPNPYWRMIASTLVVCLAIGCVVFAYRRNTVPQWVTLDIRKVRGREEIDYDNIENSVLTSLSILGHGAASEELVAQFYEALRKWEVQQEGTRDLRRDLEDRRAKRMKLAESEAKASRSEG